MILKNKEYYLWFDGASRGNPGEAGIGIVVKKSDDDIHLEFGVYLGKKTNNEAEYHGLLYGVQEVLPFNPESLLIYSDSELVVRQMQGSYKVRKRELMLLHDEVMGLLTKIPEWKIYHVPRIKNKTADMLANLAIDEKDQKKKYRIQRLSKEAVE